MALACTMTIDLLHQWILTTENKNACSLDFKLEMDFFCVLRLTLMNETFEWNTFDGFLKPISSFILHQGPEIGEKYPNCKNLR